MKLEICVDNLESAINAENGGADRIELCSALSEGGLTPSPGLFKQIQSSIDIPMHVLIRPRAGNFIYSRGEIDQMLIDMDYFIENGAQGFVLGALTADHQIDIPTMTQLFGKCEHHSTTFHRAFDLIPDKTNAVYSCIELGFDRILSSGGEETAEAGLNRLLELKGIANEQISIMPGSGIHEANIRTFIKHNFTDIHMSLRSKIDQQDHLGFADQFQVTPQARVSSVRKSLDEMM